MNQNEAFRRPTHLNALLVDPSIDVWEPWLQSIRAYQEHMAREPMEQLTFGMGAQYMHLLRLCLDNTKAVHTPYYAIFCILLYLTCTPSATMNLCRKDCLFMRDYSRELGQWLMGRTPEGQSYGSGPDECRDYTQPTVVAWIERNLEVYAYKWQH